MNLVPNDHRVRMVWRFAEGLDLTALLVGIKREGRPGIRRPILASCWRCGFTQHRGRARRAQVARLCNSISVSMAVRGVGVNAKPWRIFGSAWSGAGATSPSTVYGVDDGGPWRTWIASRRTAFASGGCGSGLVPAALTLEECHAEATAALDRFAGRRRAIQARKPARGGGAHAGGTRIASIGSRRLSMSRGAAQAQQERARRRESARSAKT